MLITSSSQYCRHKWHIDKYSQRSLKNDGGPNNNPIVANEKAMLSNLLSVYKNDPEEESREQRVER